MKTVVCTGDSHTWGQGGFGWDDMENITAGELRFVDFGCDCYVNTLRRMFDEQYSCIHTESSAELLTEPKIIRGAELIRLQFRGGDAEYSVMLGDEEITVPVAQSPNSCTNNTVFCGGEIKISPVKGKVPLYRTESYAGDFAVLNSGVGSTTTARYLDEYFDRYVAAARPDILVMEAHTINDWLAGITTDMYHSSLKGLIEAGKNVCDSVILVTVSPILGYQVNTAGYAYTEFVEASRDVSRECGVILCDAGKAMADEIDGLDEDEARAKLFCDDLHVNDLGHRIYAREIWKSLTENKLVGE